MPAHWSVLFDETLAKYVKQYIEACGESACIKVLQDCKVEIANSPLHEKQDIELPEHLGQAILKEFLPYLDGVALKEEEANLMQLEESGEDLTAEAREASARPIEAGEYWKEWDDYRVAQRLWADEVANIDKNCRDKKDKKTLGNRTGAIRQWYNSLEPKRLEEVKMAAAKWNKEGCPNKDKMDVYRKKNLRNKTVELLDALRRTMGVHSIVLHGYEGNGSLKTTYTEPTLPYKQSKDFTISSDECKDWTCKGSELLGEYMNVENDTSKEKRSTDDEGEEAPEVMVDASGHPIFPTCNLTHLKSQQDIVREIFTKAYMRITRRDRVRVPWLELARAPKLYLDLDTIPGGFKVLDPSKLTKVMIYDLWQHWRRRAWAKKPILVFKAARSQDLGLGPSIGSEIPVVKKRTSPYLELSEEEEEAGRDEADKGEGASGSHIMLPPSKRPRLTREQFVLEDDSPAANNSNRVEFLYRLSLEDTFKTLLDGVLALPTSTSESPQSSSPSNLPVWASWDWGKNYLPEEIHTDLDKFHASLGLLQECTFADRSEGIPVVLGFGLLLRDCWRSVEVEEGDESCPGFLQYSVLEIEHVSDITGAINAVIGRLPPPKTNVKMPKEKESAVGSAEGQKRTGTQKEEGSVRGRSQRERKPSKKLRGDD